MRVEVIAGRATSCEAKTTAEGDVWRFKRWVLRASGTAGMEYLRVRVNRHTSASAWESTSKGWNGKPASTSDEEKTKGRDSGHDGANAELPFIQQIQLILPKIFLPEFVGALAEVTGEILDGSEI